MKPYVEPKMRRKMGMMDSPPATAAPSPMDETEGGSADNPQEESGEGKTAFVPKEFCGGSQYKPGDTFEVKVDAVDPETGELQISHAGEMVGEEPTDTMSAFDKSMPMEGES